MWLWGGCTYQRSANPPRTPCLPIRPERHFHMLPEYTEVARQQDKGNAGWRAVLVPWWATAVEAVQTEPAPVLIAILSQPPSLTPSSLSSLSALSSTLFRPHGLALCPSPERFPMPPWLSHVLRTLPDAALCYGHFSNMFVFSVQRSHSAFTSKQLVHPKALQCIHLLSAFCFVWLSCLRVASNVMVYHVVQPPHHHHHPHTSAPPRDKRKLHCMIIPLCYIFVV